MPALAITNFNIVLSVLGGWISLFGLVSYLCKESYYMSEACKYIHRLGRPYVRLLVLTFVLEL